MTRTILVAGTASHVGKSTVAAGLCRLLADRGLSVAPFKAQNMSNNARVVPTRDGDYGEIGVSQYVQARAAGVAPTTDVNPVLLKPRGEGESQLIVNGEAVTHVGSGEYYEEHWQDALTAAEGAHARLADEHDVVVAEGAGSAGEPNLRERDLANVETARFADARVVLVADIERGGAFASVVGTLELAPEDVAERVAGVLVTKFRGDRELLAPAIDELEAHTGVPVLGVLPHDDPGLPAEDSVSLPPAGEQAVRGVDDAERTATVAVPRLPRMSNFTDLEPLAREPGIRVAYVPPNVPLDADAVVLPGTKNTVDDLLALRAAGVDEALASFNGPVVGVCGGYQMLGERIHSAEIERAGDEDSTDPTGGETVEDGDTVRGFGLLPVETTFSEEKRVARVTRTVDGVGPLAGADGEATGYEIHMGDTAVLAPVARPVGPDSAADGDVLGTYLHGLFENGSVRGAFRDAVFEAAGREPPYPTGGDAEPAVQGGATQTDPYEAAANLLREHADLEPLLSTAVVR